MFSFYKDFCFLQIKAFERGYKDVIFEELKDDIKRALKTLNSFLEGNEYFAGKNLTVADISILPSVTSFAVNRLDISLSNEHLQVITVGMGLRPVGVP